MTIVKFDGQPALRKNCRKINGEYYEMNVDCFLVNGRWNRLNNGSIAFDHENKCYAKKSEMTMGFINSDFEEGYFTPNLCKNITVRSEKGLNIALSEDILPDDYSYDTSQNIFIKNGYIKKNETGSGYGRLNYRAEFQLEDTKALYQKTSLKPTKKEKRFFSRISPYTIGLEFETSSGYIPQHSLYNAGLIAVRDGSLRQDGMEPYEYVTVPITSAQDVPIIKESCRLLNKYCKHNHRASVHVHVGGMSTNPHTVVGLWRLLQMLQDELYSYFPHYKRDGGDIPGKTNSNGQSYCAELPIKIPKYTKNYDSYISAAYKAIFDYLAGSKTEYERNIYYFQGVNKWNIPSRYHFVNIFNLLFTKSHTVEFRLHENTFNLEKVAKWIYTCVAIVKYADNNTRKCIESSEITLREVLQSAYHSKKADDICKYMEFRKDMFSRDDKFHSSATMTDSNFQFSNPEL